MSVAGAKAGLRARLETLIATGKVRKVLNGQPSTAHNLPLLYMELRDGTRGVRGQLTTNTYRIAVCLLVAFQDNTIAEDQVDALVNDIAAAIDTESTLPSGTDAVNFAHATEWSAGYLEIGDTLTRQLTWIVTVTDKGAYGGGI